MLGIVKLNEKCLKLNKCLLNADYHLDIFRMCGKVALVTKLRLTSIFAKICHQHHTIVAKGWKTCSKNVQIKNGP